MGSSRGGHVYAAQMHGLLYSVTYSYSVRSARALPLQLPPLVPIARPRSLVSRVSRAPRVSLPCCLLARTTLAPRSDRRNTLCPRSRANATSRLAFFFFVPLETHLVSCFTE